MPFQLPFSFDGFRLIRRVGVLALTGILFATPVLAQSSAQAPAPDPLRELNRSVQNLVRKVSPSVVQILVTALAAVDDKSRGDTGVIIGEQRAIGSGVIVDPNGYIVTNAHVVSGAQRLEVILTSPESEGTPIASLAASQGRVVPGRVVGLDTGIDLAVVKIDANHLPALPIAKYTDLRQGELVFAFGSPQGLRQSVTMGVVSAVARQIDPDSPTVYIQTDAAINPGNSGGALVNAEGQLVGINTMILTQSGGNEGLGFAIPSAVVSAAYPQLRRFGHLHRPEIGAAVQSISPALAAGLGLSRTSGVVVSDVVPDGPADKAGLKIQDIILTVDSRPIESLPLLFYTLFISQPGEKVQVEVLRGTQKMTLSMAAIEPQHSMDRLLDLAGSEENLVRKLGLIGLDIDAKLAANLSDLRIPSGVIVIARTIEPAAADNSLVTGDVIHALNGAPINSLVELRTALDAIKPYTYFVLQIERDSKLRYMPCQMP